MSERNLDISSPEEELVGIAHSVLARPEDAFDSGLNEAAHVLSSQQLNDRQLALGKLVTQRLQPMPDIRVGFSR